MKPSRKLSWLDSLSYRNLHIKRSYAEYYAGTSWPLHTFLICHTLLGKEGAELLFQVISMCYEKRSIIITTNLQFGQWNHVFGNQVLTEAVIDRLIHHSHLTIFTGESYRYRNSSIRS